MRVTDPKDPTILNKELGNKVDALRKEFNSLRDIVHQVRHQVVLSNLDKAKTLATNNCVFTWTGASNHLSWNNSAVVDVVNTTYPIYAGTLTLSPSTFYWMVWNKEHKVMTALADIRTLFSGNSGQALSGSHASDNNIIICQIFTGTGGQTGIAGGGGSTGGSDLIGARYKNF